MAINTTEFINWGGDTSNLLTGLDNGTYGKRLLKDVLLADHKNFVGFTPHTSGRFFIFVTKMPSVMELLFPSETKVFKKLLQYYTKGVTGFTDRTMNAEPFDTGNELSNMDIPVGTTGETKELTLEFGPELRGLPISKYISAWFRCIMDASAQAGTYFGLVYPPSGKGTDTLENRNALLTGGVAINGSLESDIQWADKTNRVLEYELANHTLSFIYFITNQARSRIEKVAFITAGYPKTEPIQALMDATWGQNQFVMPSLQLGCQVHMDNASARKVLEKANVISAIRGTMAQDLVFWEDTTSNSNPIQTSVLAANAGSTATSDSK